MDLGITPAVTNESVIRGAYIESFVYRVQDTLLALRWEQAEQILIKN